jgi:hypothetical protein
MINLTINVRNYNETRDYIRKLPIKLNKEIIGEAINEINKTLQRTMKRRVPVSSGWTRRSIMVERPSKNVGIVTINSYYAMAIEKGRKNEMFIPLQFITQHGSMPDAPGKRVNNPIWINLAGTRASQPRPFITPSVISTKERIPQIIEKYLKKAIQK